MKVTCADEGDEQRRAAEELGGHCRGFRHARAALLGYFRLGTLPPTPVAAFFAVALITA